MALGLAAALLPVSIAAQGPSAAPVQPDKAKAYYHYSLGHMLAERGVLYNRPELLSQAIGEMELALRYDPASTYLSMELADLYANTGRWRSALQEVEDNVRRNPNDPAARRLLGRLYVRLLTADRSQAAPADLRERAVTQFEQITQRDPNDVASYLILAQLYRASDEMAKAEETLRKALALQPDSSDASTQLAMLYLDMGDYRGAIDQLQRVVARDDDPEMLGMLAYAYEQIKDYRAAATAYSRALERDPENRAYRKGRAQNLLYSSQVAQALEEYQAAVKLDPGDPELFVRLSQIYRSQGKLKQARESLMMAADLAPDNLEIQYEQVNLDELEGNHDDAIGRLRQILESTAKPGPNYYTAQEKSNRGLFLNRLGDLLMHEQKFEEATEAFEEMQALGGDNDVRGRIGLLGVYQEAREYDKALAVSEEAVRQYPDNRQILTARASLLATTGDASGAVRLLEPLVGREPAQDRDLWLSMAQIRLRAKQFDEALQAAAKAEVLSESPDEKAYIHFLYGSIRERQKQFDLAEQQFRKALEFDPESAMTMNYLGYMFADQGVKLDEAVALIQKALEMEPASGAYLDSLGWAYFRQNKLELAEEYLKKALERVPTDPTILDHLGDVFFKTGRSAEAAEQWTRALQEWSRMPKNEIDPDEVSKIEQKLRNAR
jgi:tetratricopeptide (TPR) repeat protein